MKTVSIYLRNGSKRRLVATVPMTAVNDFLRLLKKPLPKGTIVEFTEDRR